MTPDPLNLRKEASPVMGTTAAQDLVTIVAIVLVAIGLIARFAGAARRAGRAAARRWREGPRKGPGLAPHIPHPHLDESAERVMAADELRPAELAAIKALDAEDYHPAAPANGRILSTRLRLELPDFTDVQIARACVALTKYACLLHVQLPEEQRWPVFTDALGLACVELSALQRSDIP